MDIHGESNEARKNLENVTNTGSNSDICPEFVKIKCEIEFENFGRYFY